MYTKVQIFNLALGMLLLQKEIVDAETDTSLEARTLRKNFDTAFRKTLQDLDLDGTAELAALELIQAQPNDLWAYVYKYPTRCAFFRGIKSNHRKDNRRTRIPFETGLFNGIRSIFTDKEAAVGRFVPHDMSLSALNVSAGLAVAAELAFLSSSLVVGKGAQSIRQEVRGLYLVHKVEAQEQDRLEGDTFDDLEIDSEFVEARTS